MLGVTPGMTCRETIGKIWTFGPDRFILTFVDRMQVLHTLQARSV
jgi:hypothetical protein